MPTDNITLALGPLAIGASASLLIAHEHRTREQAERLAAALLETLLNAFDANDAETGGHVRRVARYALILADAADVDERTQRSIERIALFHDIGKIHEALFDIIHYNDDPLTPEERRKIATHPQRGADVLAPLCAFYPDLADGVLAHHERWDGKGYPRKLRGRQIPLSARIVSIADSFDAITHHRNYSRGRSIKFARDAICAGRGTQFDPDLVDLFLCPPVFACVEQTMRDAHRPPPRKTERRKGRKESPAPDVTFRWRSTMREQHPSDQEHPGLR